MSSQSDITLITVWHQSVTSSRDIIWYQWRHNVTRHWHHFLNHIVTSRADNTKWHRPLPVNHDITEQNYDIKEQKYDITEQNYDIKEQKYDVSDQNYDVTEQNSTHCNHLSEGWLVKHFLKKLSLFRVSSWSWNHTSHDRLITQWSRKGHQPPGGQVRNQHVWLSDRQ